MIKTTIELVHDFVISNIKPNKIGPTAANKYPTDCDIPESSAAFFAWGVLCVINPIARLIEPPIPIPINTIEIIIPNEDVVIKNIIIPAK